MSLGAARTLAVFLLYLLIACLTYWPHSPFDSTHLPTCACTDPIQGSWFLSWPPFALAHGHNPLFTSYLNVPRGANLAVNTSSPLLAVLAWPVTAAFNGVASFNLLLRLGLALSALAMYLVLRRYSPWWPAAFAGGLLFGFSPYMMGHARFHMFLVFIPLVPVLIALVDDWLVRPRRSATRSGLLVGLVAALQFLISAEILALTALFIAVGVVTLALMRRAEARSRIRPMMQGLGFAAISFVLVAGYPTWMLLRGPQRPIGPLHPLTNNLNNYRGDLLSAVIPTRGQWLAPSALANRGNALVNHQIIENGFYLGLPLLLLLAFLAWRFRALLLVRVCVVVSVAAFVLSLGTSLNIGGHDTGIPMPFAVVPHIPVLQNIAAARLSFVIQTAAAILLAVGLDRLRAARAERVTSPEGQEGARWRQPQVVVAAVAIVAMLPVVPKLPLFEHATPVPRFFTTDQVNVIPSGAVVMTYPFDRAPMNNPMLWQMESGFRFKIFGGEVWVPDVRAGGRTTTRPLWPLPPPLLRLFIWPSPDQIPGHTAVENKARLLQAFCQRYHVRAIVVQDSGWRGHVVVRVVRRAFGSPRMYGAMRVWTPLRPEPLPPATTASP
ncbi:MAG TPA: hypothetical protein VFH66_11940 [Mycobacteriales bacterium]|nr:hypothetical protein [Mycobacteriales bacterium]